MRNDGLPILRARRTSNRERRSSSVSRPVPYLHEMACIGHLMDRQSADGQRTPRRTQRSCLMNRDIPKQAFAAREAYEALRDLKKLVDASVVT